MILFKIIFHMLLNKLHELLKWAEIVVEAPSDAVGYAGGDRTIVHTPSAVSHRFELGDCPLLVGNGLPHPLPLGLSVFPPSLRRDLPLEEGV